MEAPEGHSQVPTLVVEELLTHQVPRGRWGQWVSGGSVQSSGPWPVGNPWGWDRDQEQVGQQEGPRGRQEGVHTESQGAMGVGAH